MRCPSLLTPTGWPPLVLLAALLGCPKELPQQAAWRSVDAGTRSEDPAVTARRERAKRVALEAQVKKMRAAFVEPTEQTCTRDDECTLTPQHCCTCAAGGQYDAVNQQSLPELMKRRGIICQDYVCPQVMSTHPSCQAKGAVCRDGRCVPDIPAGAEEPAGIGVEPIPSEPAPSEPAHNPNPRGTSAP